MNKPIRYNATSIHQENDGLFVSYDDYAKLKQKIKTKNLASNLLSKEIKRLNEKINSTANWQPIETAPKDGTDILVYCEKYNVCAVVHYGLFRSHFCDAKNQWEDVLCWINNYMRHYPTHWMSLPKFDLNSEKNKN